MKTAKKGGPRVQRAVLTDAARSALAGVECNDNKAVIVEKLPRKTYEELNKVLEAAGGKWSRKDKAHVFPANAEAIIKGIFDTGGAVDEKKTYQVFETPTPVAMALCVLAKLRRGMRVLEPSAGGGRIAAAIKAEGIEPECIEVREDAARRLNLEGFKCLHADFLQCEAEVKFHRIIMNPPFNDGQDMAHVAHAVTLLEPGGKIISIMSPVWPTSERRKAVEFRDFLAREGVWTTAPMQAGSFKESGTDVNTLVLIFTKNLADGSSPVITDEEADDDEDDAEEGDEPTDDEIDAIFVRDNPPPDSITGLCPQSVNAYSVAIYRDPVRPTAHERKAPEKLCFIHDGDFIPLTPAFATLVGLWGFMETEGTWRYDPKHNVCWRVRRLPAPARDEKTDPPYAYWVSNGIDAHTGKTGTFLAEKPAPTADTHWALSPVFERGTDFKSGKAASDALDAWLVGNGYQHVSGRDLKPGDRVMSYRKVEFSPIPPQTIIQGTAFGGNRGTFIADGIAPGNPSEFRPLSPVFDGLAGLYPWMKLNGWEEATYHRDGSKNDIPTAVRRTEGWLAQDRARKAVAAERSRDVTGGVNPDTGETEGWIE